MSKAPQTNLHIALVHHPVLNKNREVIGSAVTNLDIHDIARTARTYGVARYFISTPYEDQHKLVQELIDHWLDGYGARYNPARKKALELVSLVRSVDEILVALQAEYGKTPILVTTSAIVQENTVEYKDLAQKIRKDEPVLLLFGTAHGLAPEVLQKADFSLPPISGGTDYNHLSVRSAASIIMDRLLGS